MIRWPSRSANTNSRSDSARPRQGHAATANPSVATAAVIEARMVCIGSGKLGTSFFRRRAPNCQVSSGPRRYRSPAKLWPGGHGGNVARRRICTRRQPIRPLDLPTTVSSGERMVRRAWGGVIFAAWLFASGASLAHHSLSAVYDIRQSGEVTGVVKKVEFMNPHGAITLAVPNGSGETTEWVLTTGSANALSSLGFGRSGPNTVVAGD